MTVAELIENLSKFPPDNEVCVVIEDEFDTSRPADIASIARTGILNGMPYVEIVGAL